MNRNSLIAATLIGMLGLSTLTSCYYYPTYAPVYAAPAYQAPAPMPTKEGVEVQTLPTTYVAANQGYVAQPYWPFWTALFSWGLWGGWWGHGHHGGGHHGGGHHGGHR